MEPDILDEMTKKEIIFWVRSQFYYNRMLPKKSEILFQRWDKESRLQQEKRHAHTKYGETLDLKKRDEYARQFNATTSTQERMVLVKKMEPYEKALRKYMAELGALVEGDEKVDALYKQIEVERERESLDI